MSVFIEQKRSLLEVIEQTEKLAIEFKQEEMAGGLSETRDQLAAEKLFLVICGEFKQGKSSLINAFLEEPDLCPVDIDIATNMIATICYGERERITVFQGKRGEGSAREITRNEIADFGTEQKNQGNIKNARLISMEIPNPRLKQNLILVDTPGVGGLNADHTDLTFAFLPNADAIIFVSDAMAPLSAVELEAIKNIHQHCKNIIFVMTKIDRVTDVESMIENSRNKLTKVLGVNEQELMIIPVSAMSKLDYLESDDPEDLEDSNFAELENMLWDIISRQKGAMMLMGALDRVGGALSNLKQPFEAEWESCRNSNKADLESLKQQFTTSRDRLNDLLENSADWRIRLSDGLQDIRRYITSDYQEGFVKIRHTTRMDLEDLDLIGTPQKILQHCEHQIDSLLAGLGKKLCQSAETLYCTIEDLSQLSLTRHDTEVLKPHKISPSDLLPQVQENSNSQAGASVEDRAVLWNKSRSAVRGGLFNINAGAVICGFVGLVVGGGLGLFSSGIGIVPGAIAGAQVGAGLGAVGGFASGAKEGLLQIDEKDKKQAQQKITTVLNQFIEVSQNACLKAVTETITQLERSIRDDFSCKLKQEKSTIEDALNRVQQTSTLTRKEAEKRASALKVSIRKIDTLIQKLESLSKGILRETSPESTISGNDADDPGDWADA